MATFYELDFAALFPDDLDPTEARWLDLEEVKIPQLQEKTSETTGGGSTMSLKLGMGIFEPPELTFKLRGVSPEMLAKIMPAGRTRRAYTIRGNLRDIEGDRTLSLKCVVRGRMTKADIGAFSRENGTSSDYQIDEVVHYSLYVDDEEVYYIDLFGGPGSVRVRGVSVFADVARNLGLV